MKENREKLSGEGLGFTFTKLGDSPLITFEDTCMDFSYKGNSVLMDMYNQKRVKRLKLLHLCALIALGITCVFRFAI